MSRKKNQKIKIIRVLDLLRGAEGMDHAMSTKQLCSILENEEIPCDRRTLADDIEVLAEYINLNPEYGFTIEADHSKASNLYYTTPKGDIASVFSFEEAKNLINAINSLYLTDNEIRKENLASLKKRVIELAPPSRQKKLMEYANDENNQVLDTFIAKIFIDSINSLTLMNDDNSNSIIDTIIKISDYKDRKLLDKEKHNPFYHKHSSQGITIFEIDTIIDAISAMNRIRFKYFDLDENRRKIYRHDGKEYTAEPLCCMQNDNFYYLICYSEESQNHLRTYRLDRMTSVKKERASISDDAKAMRETLPMITNQIFRMFSGRKETVTLEFEEKLIGAVFDKFGPNTRITRRTDPVSQEPLPYCTVTEEIQISPPFWGWLFQFVGAMRVVSPQNVVDEYKERCQQIIDGIHLGDDC